MKKSLLAVLALVLLAGGWAYFQFIADKDFELEEGFTYLYDGESLAGWRKIGGEATFTAEGEAIVGRRGEGPNTFLRTERSYRDFTLRMQVRWQVFGNSGVLFRAQQRDGDGRAYGYQYELDPSERAWSAGIYDEARRGWIANLEDNPEAREAIRLDGWNDVEIVAKGPSIQTSINGVPAADIVDALDPEGYIALQVHSGETGEIHWRRIRIQEHEELSRPGVGLSQVEDWRHEGVTDFSVVDGDMSGAWTGTEPARMTAKRLIGDSTVRFSLPACEGADTRIRVRLNNSQSGDSFAELRVSSDSASARIVNEEGERAFDEVLLSPADRYPVTWTSLGASMTVTVGETDVLRVADAGLGGRGRVAIESQPCGDGLDVAGLGWTDLKERGGDVDFYKTLDTEPALPLTPDEAQASFRLAPGFEIELVAAEPLVEEPVAMAWDEWGRLYVVEMRGYMRDAYGSDADAPVGQIVRLSDEDGDGRMDRSEVFLGELVNPRAVAVVNEGVLVGEPPNLWLCPLASREALCEERERVGDYAPNLDSGNIEHLENGLLQGLDNWLYNSKSDRRMRLVDGAMEVQRGLYRGQWGIAKDNVGRLFYNHNSTWLMGDLFQADDLVVADEAIDAEGLGVNITTESPVYSVRVNPGVNRAYLKNTLREDGRLAAATGASGLAIYRGDQFPASYLDSAFVPESAGNVVAHLTVGGGPLAFEAEQQLYDDEQWKQRDFLGSTDERFRPVDAMNGPDGALYIIDMYRGIIQDVEYLTDELREQILLRGLDKPMGMGRIWRVKYSGGEAAAISWPGDAESAELVAMLSSENGWTRDTAQRLLVAREGEETEALRQLVSGDNSLAAIHALWTLEGRGELDADTALAALAVDDLYRQQHALRAGREQFSLEQMIAIADQLESASALLRMQAVFLLGDHTRSPDARQAVVSLLGAGDGDVLVQQALVRAGSGAEMEMLADLLAAPEMAAESEVASGVLGAMAASAYRALRPDRSDAGAAPEGLDKLLSLMASRTGANSWQQVAMLEGLEPVANEGGFTPAMMATVPPIFADASVSENDPLWAARLKGRKVFTWPGDELALGIKPLSPEQLALMAKGEGFYHKCADCHGSDGAGTPGLAPPLAGVSWVTGPPEWLGRIILQGMAGPLTIDGIEWNGIMPPHGAMPDLDDETLAGLMTYLRRSWGNKADPVSVEQVAAIRDASADRGAPWSAAELEEVPFDRGFSRFVGKYKVSFVTMTVMEKEEGLYLKVPMYGEGVAEQLSDNTFKAAAGGERVKLEFVVESDGSVNTMNMYRGAEKIPLARVE